MKSRFIWLLALVILAGCDQFNSERSGQESERNYHICSDDPNEIEICDEDGNEIIDIDFDPPTRPVRKSMSKQITRAKPVSTVRSRVVKPSSKVRKQKKDAIGQRERKKRVGRAVRLHRNGRLPQRRGH